MSTLSQLGLHKETLSRLAGVVGCTYALQTAFAAVAVPLQTDKFYDLAGSLGFITSTVLSAYYPSIRSRLPLHNGPLLPFNNPLQALGSRQLLVSAMTLLWAGRLGSFLFARIGKHGKDSRFDEIKKDKLKFSLAWLGQATWITLAGLPVYLVNSIPKSAQPPLGLRDMVGLTVWCGGFALEVLADHQKSTWRHAKTEKKHDEPFIKSGLWSWSRHPNYVGEVTLWAGLAIVATSSLAASPSTSLLFSPCVAAISPLFEYVLLTKVSGVPPLEESAENKWGSTKEWQDYKDKVPVFFALPGKKI